VGAVPNVIEVSKEIMTDLSMYAVDHSLDGLTESEIEAKIQAEIEENNLSAMEKMRRDNPALNDAWEQIKTIRNLTEKQQKQIDGKPPWERHYYEIVEGVETTNETLKNAWDRYYLLKNLIVGVNKPS